LGTHPLFAAATPPKRLVSNYYDTADHRLKRAGYTLRVRTSGSRWIQTVKNTVSAEGLFDRSEWVRDLTQQDPDGITLTDTPLQELRPELDPIDLRLLFVLEVLRREVSIKTGDSRFSLALDRAWVVLTDRRQEFFELELELKEGSPDDLHPLLAKLAQGQGTTPSRFSKADRGYALLRKAAFPKSPL
jgi:triphosphatase